MNRKEGSDHEGPLRAGVAPDREGRAGVFLPAGTMCNEIVLRMHCAPVGEVIFDRSCHIVNFEPGRPAALRGVMIHAVDNDPGMFTAHRVHDAICPTSRYAPIGGWWRRNR